MNPIEDTNYLQSITRRHFFGRCAIGLGSIALASLLEERRASGAEPKALPNPMSPQQPHFAPRAKNIIYLFMAGGPSQLELFDYKPRLIELNGQAIQRACESLRTLLPASELSALHTTLTTELLRALVQLDVAPFRAEIHRIEVVSAQALTSAQSHQLEQWAMTTLGIKVAVEVKTDPALVAGLVVRLGPTVVDNSLVNRLG